MAGVNKVILIGNLGKDPDIITFDNGVKKASFPLATSENYKDKEGNKVERTEWHNIVLWRGLADVAQKYLHKGDTVFIEGKIRTRSYEVNGEKRYVTEIFTDNMTMLSKRQEPPKPDPPKTPVSPGTGGEDKLPTGKPETDGEQLPSQEDDLPF